MGFCRAVDIGQAATIRHVRAVTQVFSNANVFLYDERDWRIDYPALHEIPGPTDHTTNDVEIWVQHRLVQGAPRDTQIWKYNPNDPSSSEEELTLASSPPTGFEFDWVTVEDDPPIRGVHVHAVVGCAELVLVGPAEEITQLKIGDSILRGGNLIEEVEDEPAQSGDILLQPPEVLRLAAITIGRRIMKLELDEDAVWDDGMNTLYDGWENELESYR